MTIVIPLAKAGYGNGDPEKILSMRADIVIAMEQYESFRAQYESTFYEMNKMEKR